MDTENAECRLSVPCQRKDILRTTLPARDFSGIKKTRCSTTVPGMGGVKQFISILNDYLIWYREKRIKLPLHGLSPMEYRRKLGLI